MKRSVVEQKLNEAMNRRQRAMAQESYLTYDIKHHDAEASRIRKDRQKERAKVDRAQRSIERLTQLLLKAEQ